MWPFKRKKWEEMGKSFSSKEVRDLIGDVKNVFLSDDKYRALSKKDFLKVMFDARPNGDMRDYRPEIYDCDDFARGFVVDVRREWANKSKGNEALLFGYRKGVIVGKGTHAFIWVIDDEANMYFIEPQTDTEISKDRVREIYSTEG